MTTYAMAQTDATATIQAAMNAALAQTGSYTLPPGGYCLTSTGLGYNSNATIYMVGDLYNNHGPLVGTLYCLTNRTHGRMSNVNIIGQGGSFAGANTPANGATRKGLGIVATDGFSVTGVMTSGPLTGFGMEVKNSTNGVLKNLQLLSGANIAGADGLHFFGACSKVTGQNITVSSGDDSLSFTCENSESMNAVLQNITLSGMTLNSDAFSSIKFYTSPTTGRATIRNIQISNVVGTITRGPTGCPLMMENTGYPQGCVIEDVTITNADLNFGAGAQAGPSAFLTYVTNVTLNNITLRGRRQGQFLRAIGCKGLTVTGACYDTIPGSSMTDLVQLEECGQYSINLVIYNAAGARIGSVVASNNGTDSGTRYIGITAA